MPPLQVNWPKSGRYILAVSGGADSMVLLDLFSHAAAGRHYQLTVAHFDHGARPDSAADQKLVGDTAAKLGLPFVTTSASLARANEATARTARHIWLEHLRVAHSAAAVLTAHHQDDLIETSLLNLARGSGRLGLAPMHTSPTILRPLLNLSRHDLRAYAADHQIIWHEDSTNADITNPRNFLRHKLLPSATPNWRLQYLDQIANLNELNTKIAQSISAILEPARLDTFTYSFTKYAMKNLSQAEISELILAAARRLQPGIQLDRRLLIEIAEFAKTGHAGKFRPLRQGLVLSHTKDNVTLTTKSLP